MKLVKNILNKAYWNVYGNMKILDDFNQCDYDENDPHKCAEQSGIAFSFIALMIYLVIVNVLLINLLIAMFG